MLHQRLLIVKFLQKTKLNKLTHKIYYSYFHGFNTSNKDVLPTLEICFKKAIESGTANKGDYYEFGVFKGYTFWYAQRIAEKYNLNKIKFFGFDSFKGLPKVQGIDKTESEDFYVGQYTSSKEAVIANLNSKGVDWKRTFLVEGFFEKSLNEETKKNYKMNKIAVALIDCDIYSSTAKVLSFISNMILDKTILIFDDWECFDKDNNRGQRKAFSEFLEKNKWLTAKELFSYGLYGRVFIIILNNNLNYDGNSIKKLSHKSSLQRIKQKAVDLHKYSGTNHNIH